MEGTRKKAKKSISTLNQKRSQNELNEDTVGISLQTRSLMFYTLRTYIHPKCNKQLLLVVVKVWIHRSNMQVPLGSKLAYFSCHDSISSIHATVVWSSCLCVAELQIRHITLAHASQKSTPRQMPSLVGLIGRGGWRLRGRELTPVNTESAPLSSSPPPPKSSSSSRSSHNTNANTRTQRTTMKKKIHQNLFANSLF